MNGSATPKVGVIGAGTMGVGIAVVSILAGHRTVLRDVSSDAVAAGVGQIERFLARSVTAHKLSPEGRDDALHRLEATTSLEDVAPCTLLIEAIPEDLAMKKQLLGALDDICPAETIVASNTSTLSITRIAGGSRRPEQVVGMHFCNPAPLMKLVEVGRGLRTSETTYQRAMAVTHNLGKVPVAVRDTPGFLLNRLLIPFENDCIRLVEAGHATTESVDTAVKWDSGTRWARSACWMSSVSTCTGTYRCGSTISSATLVTCHRRWWNAWSPPAGSDESPARGSTSTPTAASSAREERVTWTTSFQ